MSHLSRIIRVIIQNRDNNIYKYNEAFYVIKLNTFKNVFITKWKQKSCVIFDVNSWNFLQYFNFVKASKKSTNIINKSINKNVTKL